MYVPSNNHPLGGAGMNMKKHDVYVFRRFRFVGDILTHFDHPRMEWSLVTEILSHPKHSIYWNSHLHWGSCSWDKKEAGVLKSPSL